MEDIVMHEHDVVVIGAGGAGLRAAIEASAAGVSVAMICKSMLGKAHTVMAEGGAAAALANKDHRDSWQTHFRDTMKGGKYLGDWRMAQIHAQQAPDRIRELEQWGAVFDRTPEGLTSQRNFGGHTYPRLAHIGDATGLELIRTLQQRGIHMGMDVFMEFTVRRLFENDGRISGCFAYDRNDGSLHVFKAKTIILATGGITRCWEVCSGSWEYTGEGHALAYWAGAEMGDMEFVQFHPTGMIWPPRSRAYWSPRESAGKAVYCETPRVCVSCSTTSLRCTQTSSPTPRRRRSLGSTRSSPVSSLRIAGLPSC